MGQKTKLTLYYVLLGGSTQDVENLNMFFATQKSIADVTGFVAFEPVAVRSGLGGTPDEFISKIISNLLLEQQTHVVSF